MKCDAQSLCLVLMYLMSATFSILMAASPVRRRFGSSLTGEVLELSHCKNMQNNAARVSPNLTQLRAPDGVFTMSTSFDISRPLKTLSKGNMRFDYCSQGVTKTCENFSNWRIGRDGCQLWTNKFTFWHGFVNAIHPRFECPFQSGHYTITNMSLDMKILEALSVRVENRDWTVTVTTFDEREEEWACFYTVVKLYRTGRRGG